jgi:CRP/FNR family transcriptional regulator, anaerobic regulatory protein
MDKRDILDGIAFYREAPPELQTGIAAVARHVRLAPGEVLFREGEAPGQVAALGAGSVRVFRVGSTGREVTLYHVRARQASLVGMLSVLLGRPTIATAQAEVATEAVLFPAAALREWVDASEAVRRFVFETVTQALVDVTSLLEDVVFRSMDSRLAALLLAHVDADGVIAMRHEDIAAELGTAREVVSRLLEAFERVGAVHRSRARIEIRDDALLRQLR